MSEFTVTWGPGMRQLQDLLARAGPAALPAVAAGLYEEALDVFAESQEQVPVRYGYLKGSGDVTLPEIGTSRVSVTVGYGGAAVDYALYVHEDLEAYHDDGKAKYLEDPVMAALPGMGDRLGQRVLEALR